MRSRKWISQSERDAHSGRFLFLIFQAGIDYNRLHLGSWESYREERSQRWSPQASLRRPKAIKDGNRVSSDLRKGWIGVERANCPKRGDL